MEGKTQFGNTKSVTKSYKINKIDDIPNITLIFDDSEGKERIWNLPTLKSDIDTVNTNVKRGNIISTPMIRNMELRKYIPTFNWMAWIMDSHEENNIPWSGYLKNFCTSEVPQAIYKAQLDELLKRVEILENNSE